MEGRSKAHGTAICLPAAAEAPEEELPGEVAPPCGVGELPSELDELPGEVAAPVLPGLVLVELTPASLSERMAKSIRPERSLMMQSLTVPRVCPDELVT